MACKQNSSVDSDKESGPGLIDVFLSDEVLERIFSYLSVNELIKLERVSKRWKDISLKSWQNRASLNLEKDLGYRFPMVHLEKILKRAGRHLIELDLSGFLPFFPTVRGRLKVDLEKQSFAEKSVYEAINSYCTKLETLKVFVEDRSGKKLQLLDDSVATNLKCLEISTEKEAGSTFETNVAELIKKANKLEEFEISAECFVGGINGSCLLNLPKTIIKLSVKTCDKVNNEIFAKVLDNLPNLKYLDIENTPIKPEVIGKVSDRLLSLIIGLNATFFASANKIKTLSLQNLRVLDIGGNFKISDKIWSLLPKKCPLLEELILKGTESLDGCLRHVVKFKNLKSLDLSDNEVSDDDLKILGKSLKKLEKIYLQSSCEFSCVGLLILISSCSNLRDFHISHFDLPDEFFQMAKVFVEARPKNIPLNIHIGVLWDGFDSLTSLIPRNDEPLTRNYCKVIGFRDRDDSKWARNSVVVRYVRSIENIEE